MYRDISTGTVVFLSRKRVNVCEHMTKTASLESLRMVPPGGMDGGKGVGKERRMERKWLESLMCEGRDWRMDWRWKSTKAEIRSVTE